MNEWIAIDQVPHDHTYSFTVNDGISYAVSALPVEIEKLDGTKDRMANNGIKVVSEDGLIRLKNHNNQIIDICNASESQNKIDNLLKKANELPENTIIDRRFKQDLIKFLREGI